MKPEGLLEFDPSSCHEFQSATAQGCWLDELRNEMLNCPKYPQEEQHNLHHRTELGSLSVLDEEREASYS